jgi:hypothetical protein
VGSTQGELRSVLLTPNHVSVHLDVGTTSLIVLENLDGDQNRTNRSHKICNSVDANPFHSPPFLVNVRGGEIRPPTIPPHCPLALSLRLSIAVIVVHKTATSTFPIGNECGFLLNPPPSVSLTDEFLCNLHSPFGAA